MLETLGLLLDKIVQIKSYRIYILYDMIVKRFKDEMLNYSSL